MDVKTAIETGDAVALRAALEKNPAAANELIRWGKCETHPLHYVSDVIFNGVLERGKELPIVDALLAAGSQVDFQRAGSETALHGAASLGADEVGLSLLRAGAKPDPLGMFGETPLHWAALLGMDRLAIALIAGTDLKLRDARYQSTPLGWAVHGWMGPPAGNQGRQREVVRALIAAGAKIEPELIEKAREHPEVLAALQC